jgi:hypothetical protein
MMQFWSSGDRTGSRVENKVETIDLSSRKIEQERVVAINFRLNERRSNSRSDPSNCKYAVKELLQLADPDNTRTDVECRELCIIFSSLFVSKIASPKLAINDKICQLSSS